MNHEETDRAVGGLMCLSEYDTVVDRLTSELAKSAGESR